MKIDNFRLLNNKVTQYGCIKEPIRFIHRLNGQHDCHITEKKTRNGNALRKKTKETKRGGERKRSSLNNSVKYYNRWQ